MATGAKTCKECQEQQAELLPLDSTNRQSKEHVSQLLSGVGDAVTTDKSVPSLLLSLPARSPVPLCLVKVLKEEKKTPAVAKDLFRDCFYENLIRTSPWDEMGCF